MQASVHRRWLLPALIPLAVLALVVSYSPLVQVEPVEASSTSLTVHGTYGVPVVGVGQCEFGGTALALGGHQLRGAAFWNHCSPSALIGICVRLYRNPTPLTPGESQLALIGQKCIPQHAGDGADATPALVVGCQAGRSYSLWVTFFVYGDSPQLSNSPMSCP